MSENTTVIVSKKTRDALKSMGRKGESYDDVIRRLIRLWMEKGVHYDLDSIKPLLELEEA